MVVFVMLDWTYRELQEDSPEIRQAREVQQYKFANDARYSRVWAARKSAFDPEFIAWMEANVVNR